MWKFAFNAFLEGGEGTECEAPVEGVQPSAQGWPPQSRAAAHLQPPRVSALVQRATQGSNNWEICPLPLIVGSFLLAERRIRNLFLLILNSCLVVPYVLLAGCQMDHVPFFWGWDLEKPRVVKGLDPFTQPPHGHGSL